MNESAESLAGRVGNGAFSMMPLALVDPVAKCCPGKKARHAFFRSLNVHTHDRREAWQRHALLDGSKLSLTQLGRHRAGSASEKHHIKAADRLLANRHLHAERDGSYRAIARTLLTGIKRPMIIVHWSDMEPRRRWLVIRAAAAVGGRAVSLYEKVYPMKRYKSPRTQREFLLALRAVLPEGCSPSSHRCRVPRSMAFKRGTAALSFGQRP